MITKVTSYLDSLNIPYQLSRHTAVVTTEQSKQVIHVENCLSCKSLFVKDKKSDNYYMVVLTFEKRANMRGLASYVGCAKFEFATEEILWQRLKVRRGSVSPYAFLNEEGNSIPLLIDRDVWEGSNVKFHPCDNTATVVVSVKDFKRYLSAIGPRVIVVDAN